jgi:hypothetical protein
MNGRAIVAEHVNCNPRDLVVVDGLRAGQKAYRLSGVEVATIDYARDHTGETGPGDSGPKTLVTISYRDGSSAELRFRANEPMILD